MFEGKGKAKAGLERQNFILTVLRFFSAKGEKEVSLSEFLECISDIQKEAPLDYEFSERFLYSLGLLEDLRELEYKGFVHRFMYRHDSFLPKRFIVLTGVGEAHSERTLPEIPKNLLPVIEKSVTEAIKSNRERWKLYERPMNLH